MFRVFNMGLGMIAAVPPELADAAIDELGRAGYPADRVGATVAGASEVELAGAART
jgi:phosphoribosylaminoimidazole (AIR) synthetase